MSRSAAALLLLLACLDAAVPVRVPAADRFQVSLRQDATSAERLLDLFEGMGNPADVAALPGSRITLATTALLAGEPLTEEDLRARLEEAKFGHLVREEAFQLAAARANAPAVRELLREMKNRNFTQRVVATVRPLFPEGTAVSAEIPLYVTAFGHSAIDAFVRRVAWRGDRPQFVGEGEGEPVIVLNLASSVRYGTTTAERFVWTLSVCAHEVFHAAFTAVKERTPAWQAYYAAPGTPLDVLLDLTQNEGVAYHMSMEQRVGDALPPDWDARARAAFAAFDRHAAELSSPGITAARAGELIRAANTSSFWESYGAVAGMVMARGIDRALGRAALAETLLKSPGAFVSTYLEVSRRQGDLPRFSPGTEELLRGAR